MNMKCQVFMLLIIIVIAVDAFGPKKARKNYVKEKRKRRTHL